MQLLTRTPADDARHRSLPAFDGYPYLMTRVVSGLYHLLLLPADRPIPELYHLAERQVAANRLETCLVLAADRSFFFAEDGSASPSVRPPRGGVQVAGKLHASQVFPRTPERLSRADRLEAWVEAMEREMVQSGDAFLFGDLTKGGRPVKPHEIERLTGLQANGVPRGLELCPLCGEWKGECLDPHPRYAGLVMTVRCRCQAANRCARCGDLLYDRPLNANYYRESDGQIWHVPGFFGLDHRCLR